LEKYESVTAHSGANSSELRLAALPTLNTVTRFLGQGTGKAENRDSSCMNVSAMLGE
jgi:hypothetical protein